MVLSMFLANSDDEGIIGSVGTGALDVSSAASGGGGEEQQARGQATIKGVDLEPKDLCSNSGHRFAAYSQRDLGPWRLLPVTLFSATQCPKHVPGVLPGDSSLWASTCEHQAASHSPSCSDTVHIQSQLWQVLRCRRLSNFA